MFWTGWPVRFPQTDIVGISGLMSAEAWLFFVFAFHALCRIPGGSGPHNPAGAAEGEENLATGQYGQITPPPEGFLKREGIWVLMTHKR
jgi:hypothetical protein